MANNKKKNKQNTNRQNGNSQGRAANTQNKSANTQGRNGQRKSGQSKGNQNKKSSGTPVARYRRPSNVNIGMLIFLVILIYVLYSVVRYATAKQVVAYAVRSGSISENTIYEGLALRTEEVVYADYAGNINYYSKDGTRLAAGKLVYTIDETGEISSKISEATSTGALFTSDDYNDIRTDIEAFTESFAPEEFSSIYSFKDSLGNSIQKITNNSILTDIESIGESASIHYVNTGNTGYVVYATDGYEYKTFETVTASDFDSTNYTSTEIENNAMVSVGDPVYRLETDEDWSIVIRLDSAETAQELADLGVVKVRFIKNRLESWATITTRSDADGNWYANLAFTNSMITFATDRFIDIELLTETTNGLKIPKTALVDGEFYIVPADYVTEGSTGNSSVLREIYDENGEKSTEVVTVTVYNEEDGNVWLDQDALRSGDILDKLDSNDTYTVAQTGQLTGVYNINEGYADFRQVTVIAENDEYAIVESNSTYGLREYDYIVLDATTMTPDEFLYE